MGDSRSQVIRRKEEAFHTDCLKRKVKFPASIMVWGCMSARGVGNLYFIDGTVNAKVYINILEQNLLPSIGRLRGPKGYIFQQDGAACHTAKLVRSWFEQHDIPLLPWVSSSPDLSPIETLWHKMKQALRKNPARNKEELMCRLRQIWESFSAEECSELVQSMPKRLKAVIKRKGDVTQY